MKTLRLGTWSAKALKKYKNDIKDGHITPGDYFLVEPNGEVLAQLHPDKTVWCFGGVHCQLAFKDSHMTIIGEYTEHYLKAEADAFTDFHLNPKMGKAFDRLSTTYGIVVERVHG